MHKLLFMNIKIFKNIAVANIVTTLIFSPLISQKSYAEITVAEVKQQMAQDRVTFYCGEIVDVETKKIIPTTVAYNPSKGNISIIAWESEHLSSSSWKPKRRCEAVSQKFQTFYEKGHLNYLTNGSNSGYPIICAVPNKEEICNGENQLFQLHPDSKAEDVIAGLQEILYSNSSADRVNKVKPLLKRKVLVISN